MKKAITAILFCSALLGFSQENHAALNIVKMLEKTQDQILSLAGEFNQEQLGWRPSEGIRSTGETIMHVAASYYYIAMGLGYPTPQGVDILNMEGITEKAEILEAFEYASDFICEKILEENPADFLSVVDLGFDKMNRLSVLMTILQHTGEHKGQLITYARSNGLAPPWSQAK
ncbi:MAG: DinB family protein [Robiginitalea sp.]|nr:DinB family protein [Robiginitalea sp.]